jgi:type IV secretory pathway TraG/TraD family ATPase VirD4
MPATEILRGQIVVVLATVFLTTWVATRWTAWRLGYQPEQGQPWFELAQVFRSIFRRRSSGGGSRLTAMRLMCS